MFNKVFDKINSNRNKNYSQTVNFQKPLKCFYDIIYQKDCTMLFHNKQNIF